MQTYDKPAQTATDWELENLALDLVVIARSEPFVRAHQLVTRKVRQYINQIGKSS